MTSFRYKTAKQLGAKAKELKSMIADSTQELLKIRKRKAMQKAMEREQMEDDSEEGREEDNAAVEKDQEVMQAKKIIERQKKEWGHVAFR